MLILGPPGTGKTHYLSNNIVPSLDGKVCVLSFTKAGAKEIADRLDGRGNFVGTIHSFCFKELEMISQQVFDDRSKFLQIAGGKHVEKYLDAYDIYRNTGEMPEIERNSYNSIVKNYEKFKDDRGQLDFTDMITFCMRRDLTAYDYVVVDEAQDLTPLQWKLVNKIPCKEIIAAGDDDQGIFAWAGADVMRMRRVGGEKIVLDQSYRIPKNILLYSKKVLERIHEREAKEYKPTNEEGSVRFFATIHELLRYQGNITILVRDNYLKRSVEDFLMRVMIPLKRVINGKYKKAFDKGENVPVKYRIYFDRTKQHDWSWDVRTIHTSKGLEWDNVAVMATYSGKVESGCVYQDGRDAEARNWYVAVTRAKKNLFIIGHNKFLPYWRSE